MKYLEINDENIYEWKFKTLSRFIWIQPLVVAILMPFLSIYGLLFLGNLLGKSTGTLLSGYLSFFFVGFLALNIIPTFNFKKRKFERRLKSIRGLGSVSFMAAVGCSYLISTNFLGLAQHISILQSNPFIIPSLNWYLPILVFLDIAFDTITVGIPEIAGISILKLKADDTVGRLLLFLLKLFVTVGLIDYLKVVWELLSGEYKFTGTTEEVAKKCASSLMLRNRHISILRNSKLTELEKDKRGEYSPYELSHIFQEKLFIKRWSNYGINPYGPHDTSKFNRKQHTPEFYRYVIRRMIFWLYMFYALGIVLTFIPTVTSSKIGYIVAVPITIFAAYRCISKTGFRFKTLWWSKFRSIPSFFVFFGYNLFILVMSGILLLAIHLGTKAITENHNFFLDTLFIIFTLIPAIAVLYPWRAAVYWWEDNN